MEVEYRVHYCMARQRDQRDLLIILFSVCMYYYTRRDVLMCDVATSCNVSMTRTRNTDTDIDTDTDPDASTGTNGNRNKHNNNK